MVIALIGCAPGWENDLNKLQMLTKDFDVMAIGMDCPYAGEIKYMATYHPADILPYKEKRRAIKCNTDFKVISHVNKENIDIVEPHKNPSGSSALLGTIVAIKLGYAKVILVGCPIEGVNKKDSTPYGHFQKGWVARMQEVSGYVKSMSGWSSDIFGEPTKEWIKN